MSDEYEFSQSSEELIEIITHQEMTIAIREHEIAQLHADKYGLQRQVSDLLSEVEHVEDERDEALNELGNVTEELTEVRESVRHVLADLEILHEIPLKDLEDSIWVLVTNLRDVL